MASGRRLAVLVVALALVGAPAVALRAFCAGKSCAGEDRSIAAVPFCSLPSDLRAQIEAGYRPDRSPDVMATTRAGGRLAGNDGVPWPRSPYTPAQNQVPLLFFGRGIVPGRLASGVSLDRIAPTLARAIGFDRPHREVRSGTPLTEAVTAGARPRLIVEIVWTGVGSAAFGPAGLPWPRRHLRQSAWTFEATTSSLPVDPAAILTTIGTGGLPSQHGIVGSTIRNSLGQVVRAWSRAAPTSVIATLADDLDQATDQRARIGLVAARATDRGLVGGTWYLDHDRDDVVIGSADPMRSVSRMLATGYGSDGTADILGVTLRGSIADMGRQTRAIVGEARRKVPDTIFVLTATGDARGASRHTANVVAEVERRVGGPVVSATTAGGLLLDRDQMIEHDVTSDDIVGTMDALKTAGGTSLFVDAYPGFAISFSRYC